MAHVSVTPSVFPEAFGMVAAEAAACGSPPLVANHSGLAEIAGRLQAAYPPEHRDLAGFATDDLDDLSAKLARLLALNQASWREVSAAARRVAVEAWSWPPLPSGYSQLSSDQRWRGRHDAPPDARGRPVCALDAHHTNRPLS